jgi:hypothetical protein
MTLHTPRRRVTRTQRERSGASREERAERSSPKRGPAFAPNALRGPTADNLRLNHERREVINEAPAAASEGRREPPRYGAVARARSELGKLKGPQRAK